MERINQVVFLSATPGPYELKVSTQVAEQIVRPTGLVDPEVVVRPTKGQIDDLIEQIGDRTERGDRVLVTTLTKKMAEDLTDYLLEQGLRVRYLHSNVDTIQRIEILRDLRLGEYDVLVGINLLREGLDLPEVSLVAILDADKEGFLRSETSLIQTIGRAARHVDGQVIMYADQVTDSMRRAISETQRRRQLQLRHNEEHGIDPQTIRKAVTDILSMLRPAETAPGAGQGPALAAARPGAPRPRRAARRRGAAADPHPRGGDARGEHRAALRVRRSPPRRDQGPEARAAGRRLTTVAAPRPAGGRPSGLSSRRAGYARRSCSSLSWLRHRNHWTGFDLAIFDQAAWQIAEGRDHISIVERHVMADHFSPVLYLFGGLLPGGGHARRGSSRAQADRARGHRPPDARRSPATSGSPASWATLLVVLQRPAPRRRAVRLPPEHPRRAVRRRHAALRAVQDRPVRATVAAVGRGAVPGRPRARASWRWRSWRARAPAGPSRPSAVVAAAVSAVVPGRFGDTNGWAPHFGHLGDSPVAGRCSTRGTWPASCCRARASSILVLWVVAAGVAVVVRPRWLAGAGRRRAPGAALAMGGHRASLVPLRRSDGADRDRAAASPGSPPSPIDRSGGRSALRSLWWVGPGRSCWRWRARSRPVAPEANRVWTRRRARRRPRRRWRRWRSSPTARR